MNQYSQPLQPDRVRLKCAALQHSDWTIQLSGSTASATDEAPVLAPFSDGGEEMLYTLAVILLVAWLLGMVGTYTIGAFVHLLLVIALVLFIVGLLGGRRTVV
jgi:hypothetical protein